MGVWLSGSRMFWSLVSDGTSGYHPPESFARSTEMAYGRPQNKLELGLGLKVRAQVRVRVPVEVRLGLRSEACGLQNGLGSESEEV